MEPTDAAGLDRKTGRLPVRDDREQSEENHTRDQHRIHRKSLAKAR